MVFTSDQDRASLEERIAKELGDRKMTLERFTTETRPLPGSVHAIEIDAKAVG